MAHCVEVSAFCGLNQKLTWISHSSEWICPFGYPKCIFLDIFILLLIKGVETIDIAHFFRIQHVSTLGKMMHLYQGCKLSCGVRFFFFYFTKSWGESVNICKDVCNFLALETYSMDPNKLQGFNKLKQLETTKTGSVPVNVWSNGDKAQQRNSLIVSHWEVVRLRQIKHCFQFSSVCVPADTPKLMVRLKKLK